MNPLQFPKLEKYVNDFSQVFDAQKVEELSTLFKTYEDATTAQVVTILFPHRQGNELLDIWLKVFNENGIGQKDTNNGLLLIIATEEKKLRIVVWKWLEYIYTNFACKTIIETRLRPLLNEGKYEELVKEWYKIVSAPEKEIPKQNSIVTYTLIGIILTFTVWFPILWAMLIITVSLWVSHLFFWSILSILWGGIIAYVKHNINKNPEYKISQYVVPLIIATILILAWINVLVPQWGKEMQCIGNTSQECINLRTPQSWTGASGNWTYFRDKNGVTHYPSTSSHSSSHSHFWWWGGGSHGGGGWD